MIRKRRTTSHGHMIAVIAILFVAVGKNRTPVLASESVDVLSELANSASDSTESIQKLLDDKAKTGGTIKLPPKRFIVAGQLNIPEAVTLEGSWEGSVHYMTTQKNTVLMITGRRGLEDFTAKDAIHLNGSSALRGLTIAYPEQEYPAIVPYPWTITGDGDCCIIRPSTCAHPSRSERGKCPDAIRSCRSRALERWARSMPESEERVRDLPARPGANPASHV